jgi:hypothetical protein
LRTRRLGISETSLWAREAPGVIFVPLNNSKPACCFRSGFGASNSVRSG